MQAQFELGKDAGDGSTQKEHLQVAERQLTHEDRAAVDWTCPEPCRAVWEAFITLHNRRGSGMSPNPISYADVREWEGRHRVDFSEWEFETLMVLDDLALKIQRKSE